MGQEWVRGTLQTWGPALQDGGQKRLSRLEISCPQHSLYKPHSSPGFLPRDPAAYGARLPPPGLGTGVLLRHIPGSDVTDEWLILNSQILFSFFFFYF